MSLDKTYQDVPGTTIFDAEQSAKGYHLNQFCMSLMKPANRERFMADQRAYLDEWEMSEEQKQAVLDRDLNGCIALGGNIYFLAKIGATDGLSFQQMAGSMTGMSEAEYRAMMLAGGRSIEGNRIADHVREAASRAAPAGADRAPGHHRQRLHLARARDRRRDRPRQDRGALLEEGVRRVRGFATVDPGGPARRRLPRLQRPRHGLQPRPHPDLRDRHGRRTTASPTRATGRVRCHRWRATPSSPRTSRSH